MGGSAFKNIGNAAFPRMPSPIYQALKARLTPVLETLFEAVATPAEVPRKPNHGDLDFTVSCPKLSATSGSDLTTLPARVKSLISATEYIPMAGNRTSHFAIPIQQGEWAAFGETYAEIERLRRRDCETLYYQVDVHVCGDKAELDRIVFFNSYGDLGMILGLIAANVGLKLGSKGLKCPNQPYEPILLSQNFDEIVHFFGLSMVTRLAGFNSKEAIFEWVGSSRFFNPLAFRSSGSGITKVKEERTMYAEFVTWAQERAREAKAEVEGRELDVESIRKRTQEEALVQFNKKAAYDEVHRVAAMRAQVKELFKGANVGEWTNLNSWQHIQMVMNQVRSQPEWEKHLLAAAEKDGEEGVKRLVLDAMEVVKDQFEDTGHQRVG